MKTHRVSLYAAFLLTVALFVVRVTGPSNLMAKDQERPASYVLDVLLHGKWLCQRDWSGDIMSKPPLFTWMATLATLPVGHANLVSLYFPCLVAMLALVGMLFYFGSRNMGWRAGFLAALMCLASPAGVKHIALARTDALFAATVALTAFLGFRAWKEGRGWEWFWLAAALSTLTKGPLGLLLGAIGLLMTIWERREQKRGTTNSQERARAASYYWTSHLSGFLLFIGIAGGWFWLAYRDAGQPFVDKVIGRELVGHAVGNENGTFGAGFLRTPFYWLTRFLPWSLLAALGLWRVCKYPSPDLRERQFERFLFCWIVGGLVVFSLATHQRGDLILPLIAPAALLAGRELARGLAKYSDSQVQWTSLAASAVLMAGYARYQHTVYARANGVRVSEDAQSLARQLKADPVIREKLLFADSPFALQFHLNTMERPVSFEPAAAALAKNLPVFVAVNNLDELRRIAGSGSMRFSIIARSSEEGGSMIQIVTNPSGQALHQRRQADTPKN